MNANPLTIETVGRRLYVGGDSYAAKNQLKSIGCKWDADRSQWWIGTGKRAELEAVIGHLANQESDAKSLDDSKVYGKVAYTSQAGKRGTYYVIAQARDGSRVRLATIDGSINFWADSSVVEWLKRYSPRTVGRGRWAKEEYQTLGGLRRFIERAKAGDANIRPSSDHVRCRHCGEWTMEGDDWCTACGMADYER